MKFIKDWICVGLCHLIISCAVTIALEIGIPTYNSWDDAGNTVSNLGIGYNTNPVWEWDPYANTYIYLDPRNTSPQNSTGYELNWVSPDDSVNALFWKRHNAPQEAKHPFQESGGSHVANYHDHHHAFNWIGLVDTLVEFVTKVVHILLTEEDISMSLWILGALTFYTLVLLVFNDKTLQPRCTPLEPNGFLEWEFHAGRRLIPPPEINPHIQHEFLELFRIKKKRKNHDGDDDDSSNSSEEGWNQESGLPIMHQFSKELSHINEMCPRDAFFYGMAPRHNEAVIMLRRLLVAQGSPVDVLHVAKAILLSKQVNPKVWYLALLAASIERPDMNGFALPQALDAMPDMFIPAHLIQNKWRRDELIDTSSSKNSSSFAFKSAKIKKYKAKSNAKKDKKVKNIRKTRDVNLNETIAAEDVIHLFGVINNDTILTNAATFNESIKSDRKYLVVKNKSTKKKKTIQNQDTIQDENTTAEEGGDDKDKKCIKVDGSIGEDNGVENRLWYFREDMMLNQHHAYWHQLYPVNATRHGDRRAELFFFMHRQMLARYNSERLANGFSRTYELQIKHGSIMLEGYNSHLADINSGKFWTPRRPFTPIGDIIHIGDPDFRKNILIDQVQALIKRFIKAIKIGKLSSKKLWGKSFVPIHHENGIGINPLGNTIEASELSTNPFYYDGFGLHNMGHQLIGLLSDPKFELKLATGVMSEAAVSMRDPAFYTYHTIMDNLFERFKATLPPYRVRGGPFPLIWDGVEILEAGLTSVGNHVHPLKELRTFWVKKRFELTTGIDGSVDKGGKVDVCSTHLDHEPFGFRFVINRKPCAQSKSGVATVRVMMAPRYDENGKRLQLKEQRRIIFTLDVFQVDLKVGKNTITRRAEDSSLTVPWGKSLHELERDIGRPTSSADYCGCGWPRHLLIPRGKKDSMIFDLFVMVTNYDNDFVRDNPRDLKIPEKCNSAHIFCGRPFRRYPDSKPMGYPFDRPVYKIPAMKCHLGDVICDVKSKKKLRAVATLEEYTAAVPNMAMASFGIRHIEKLFKSRYVHLEE